MPVQIDFRFVNEPFEDCASKVELVLTDEHRKHRAHFTLGVMDAERIYEAIDAQAPLKLDSRYIKNFSLSNYRHSRGLDEQKMIHLHEFSAEHSFWDGESAADFSFAKFTGERTSFKHSIFGDGPISFYSSVFSAVHTDFAHSEFGAGNTNFQYAEFSSATVRFDESHFKAGDLIFVNSSFGDSQVSFKEVDFGNGKVDFRYTKFGDGSLSFDKAQFGGGEVSFKRVDFGHGKFEFKRANFGDGLLDFSEAVIKSGKLNFRSAVFGNGDIDFQQVNSSADIIFDHAVFGGGKLLFYKALARKLSFQYCHFNNYVDLRVTKANRVDFSYTIVRDVVDMMPTEKAAVNIQEFTINGMRNLGNLYIDWISNRVLQLIRDQPETTSKQKSEQFLVLKETFNQTGRYADEDKAYIWYKRYELKAYLEVNQKSNLIQKTKAYVTAFFKWLVFDKIGLYATEPLRVLFSVSVIYVLFSFAYLLIPFFSESYIDTGAGEDLENMHPFTKAFYFSAITFLTVGYGDFYPVGFLRLLASVEGYVGVFLMGYFSVAFVRKVLR